MHFYYVCAGFKNISLKYTTKEKHLAELPTKLRQCVVDEDLYLKTLDVPFTFFALYKWIKGMMPYDGVFPSTVSLEILFHHSLPDPQDKYSCNTTKLGEYLLTNEGISSGSRFIPKDPQEMTTMIQCIGQGGEKNYEVTSLDGYETQDGEGKEGNG